jgi:hypothetical protein
MRVGVGVLGIIAVVAIGFVVKAQSLKVLPSSAYPPFHGSFVVLTDHVLGLLGGYAREAIGVFGWLDTPSPLLTLLVWTALAGFVVIAGIAASTWHERTVLVALMAGAVVITMGLIELNAGTAGITWQARDGFPLYAGIPLVAGTIVSSRPVASLGSAFRSRAAAVIAVAVGIGQLAAFLWTLRRYTVGLGRTVNLFHHVKGGWSPPLGIPLMVVVGVLAVGLYAAQLFGGMRDELDVADSGDFLRFFTPRCDTGVGTLVEDANTSAKRHRNDGNERTHC